MFEEMVQIFKDSFYRQWPSLATMAMCCVVMACSPQEQAREDRQSNEEVAMDNDMATKGFTEVGTTPDGQPLYMKVIRKGYLDDRVYFTKDSITAHENCGKNCEKNITTLRH